MTTGGLAPAALFDLSGRHVLVTGATQGIGEMLARGFHAAGATVHLSARTAADCDALVAELGERATALPADVSDAEGCTELARTLGERTDRLDVLVNNAGTSWGAPLEEYPDGAWDKVLGLNLKSPFNLSVACLPLLRAAATPQSPARIINVGSVDGMSVPRWESYAYSSSKAAIHHLTRHLAHRLAPEHVTVNAIAYGVFPSRMTRFAFEAEGDEIVAAIPLGRSGLPEDAVGVAVLLASRAGAWMTGTVIPVDGGYSTLR